MTKIEQNPRLAGFVSLDGREHYDIEDFFLGAPIARAEVRPTSLAAEYRSFPSGLPAIVGGMPAYAEWLPYTTFPTLGEGGTPVIALGNFAAENGLETVLLKCEFANPTGSHKDRMSPLAVARALEIGARGVACASSGNAAVSLAAYAAHAGVPCRILATSALPQAFRQLLDAMGAVLDIAADSLSRWKRMEELVTQAWFPVTNYALPASGSNPFGVQGYRTIAFELWQQAGPIDAVIVPTARGDLIWGIHDGYRSLLRAGLLHAKPPRLIAIEPFPRLTRVLAEEARTTDRFLGQTRQFSTAGETTTDQAFRAVRETGGTAIAVDDDAAATVQTALAQQGHDLELCAAAAIAALPMLRSRDVIGPGERVVVIGTASAAKNIVPLYPPAS